MNQLSQFIRFVKDVRGEVSRIYWPSWADTRRLTLMVVVLATIVSLYLTVVDMAIGSALGALFGIKM